MKIPKHWGKGTAQSLDGKGKVASFSCWHWSEISEADARHRARDKAEQILAKWLAGEKLNAYSYGERPLREEIVQVISNRRKNEIALVTRNSYGALVLNAANAMFIDIDFDPSPGSLSGCLLGIFGNLFRKKRAARENEQIQGIQRWAEAHRELGIRVYRTYAGLRCLITNLTFDPVHPNTTEMMKELVCDPLYIKLCRQQECFRARLTPKPWRCRIDKPAVRYPFEAPQDEQRFRQWEDNYRQAAFQYAVCEMVTQIGSLQVHPDIEPILSLHDQFCCSGQGLALA